MELHDIKYIAAREEVNSKLKGITTFLEGVKLQSNIRTSVEKFGLTKATWLAVQDLPPARNLFKELPSLESLDAIGVNVPVKENELPVNAVIKTTLAELSYAIKSYLEEAVDSFNHLKSRLEIVEDHFNDLADMEFNTQTRFFGLPAFAVHEQLERIEDVFLYLARMKLSKDSEVTETELEELETQVSGVVNAKFRGNVPDTLLSSMWNVDRYNEYSFHDAGYTKETMDKFLTEIGNCLDLSLGLLKYKTKVIVNKLNPVPLADTADVDVTSFDESDISQEDTLVEYTASKSKFICLIYWLLDSVRQLTLQVLSVATSMIVAHSE